METNATNQKTYSTTYAVATSYIGGSLILCNNIERVDEELLYGETLGLEYDEETEEYPEIYQYYLTSWRKDEVEWLNKHFGLMFAYSDSLDLWVLLVHHCGTAWSCVKIKTDLHEAAAPLGTHTLQQGATPEEGKTTNVGADITRDDKIRDFIKDNLPPLDWRSSSTGIDLGDDLFVELIAGEDVRTRGSYLDVIVYAGDMQSRQRLSESIRHTTPIEEIKAIADKHYLSMAYRLFGLKG